jgi:geranylgeranyl diphosphate synthase type II
MTQFLETLAQYRQLVWQTIQPTLNTPIPGISELENQAILDLHWQLICDYPLRGGKYFRPSWLLLTLQALGGTLESGLTTAAAMELSENWLLIHDDFEDNSEQRRGKPALHRLYSPELAINAGDSLHLVMWHTLRQNFNHLPTDLALRVHDEFYRMLMRTALGQTAEIQFYQANRTDLSEEDIFYIMDGKTGYYTLAGPMRLGAILAVPDLARLQGEVLPQLDALGKVLGRAFQITDDLLDLTSDFSGLKAQIGNDIYEGKRTIMLIHLLQHASPAHHAELLAILQKPRPQKTPAEVAQVLAWMDAYGSLAHGQALALQFAAQARQQFHACTFFLPGSATEALAAGIEFIINRTH